MSATKRGRAEGEVDDQAVNETTPEEAKKVELMDLPEEMLVEILSYLDDELEVLRLRAVCRRWRGLLLHPDVWRHRSLSDRQDTDTLLDAVLSAPAPCLLRLSLRSAIFLNSHGALAAFTQCAVKEIELTLKDKDVGLAALLIRNQAALGRLRVVKLNQLSPPVPLPPDYRILLKALCEVEGLSLLSLDWDYAYVEPDGAENADLRYPVPNKTAKSSLTTFVSAKWLPDAVLEHLLRSHAATLEVVDVESFRPGCRTPVAALLAEMPNLRDVRCGLLPYMVKLKECPALKELTLVLPDSPHVDLLWDAQVFLREAVRLEKVTLHVSNSSIENKVLGKVINAVAASRCSQVKTIALVARDDGFKKSVPVPSAVCKALVGLLELQDLDVSLFEISKDLFEAITPNSAPSLRWLTVRRRSGAGCSHAWFHSPAVSNMLRQNRSLHLEFKGKPDHCVPDEGSVCEYCSKDCHFSKDRDQMYDTIAVFAHSACSEEHGDGFYWCELTD